ncbi:MAG: hypothetical protein RBR93_11880 [Aliarcobacter butzleri]|nr:hypothetical protein [Aliarcobacter butzleri]
MNEYNTNIPNLTCSCPDWKETRVQYSISDPRRLCKHIINKLDIDNLPNSIAKFKESIKFYQEKEWGFKRNFDGIIELQNITMLCTSDSVETFDKFGKRCYAKRRYMSDSISWFNEQKPLEYKEVEKYLIQAYEVVPILLEEEEYDEIIRFIKETLPDKKNLFIAIKFASYIHWEDGIFYDICTSISPISENDISRKSSSNEYYHFFGETSLNDNELRWLHVTNHEIIVELYSGKEFRLERNYQKIKQLKDQRELKEGLEQKEDLERQREMARDSGCILSSDYKGNLYVHPSSVSREENEYMQKSILATYDSLQNLLKKESVDISTSKFYRALKNLKFITKEPLLNQNNWIIKGNGLDYGINLIRMSKYMHATVPEWYEVAMFDYQKKKLVNLKNIDIKMTSPLFQKNKFNELCQLVKLQIENEQAGNKGKNTAQNSKQLEREKWLRHVNCPNCGEKTNIHKKDKRKLVSGCTYQRFYCNECNSMFQMDINELETLIQEYKKNEIKKDKFTTSKETVEVQSVVKEEIEPVEKSKSEEKETNAFKKFFSFLK